MNTIREYKIAKGWAIFIYITVPLLIALFGSVFIVPFIPGMENEINPSNYWFLFPISICMIIFMVIAIIDTNKAKFVIDKDKIYTISTFSNRQLFLNEIKGYRLNDKFIFIEPINKKNKKIKVSTYFENTNEIKEWLANNYSDLNQIEVEQEKEELLKNEDFGWTQEQREEKLKTAQKIAKILNWTGGLIGVWTVFLAKPYEYAIIASILFPIICLASLKLYNGIIRIDGIKNSVYPTVTWALFASCMGLCLRSLFDFNIFDYSRIWMPSILIALTFVALLAIGSKEFNFKKIESYLILFSTSMLMFAYGYGTIVTLNYIYDKSEPETYNAIILNKRISNGKRTTYYFELSKWGTQTEIDEVSISKDLFNTLNKNDTVNIYFMKGQFDIPWFVLSEH